MNAKLLGVSMLSSLAGGLAVFGVMTQLPETGVKPVALGRAKVVVDNTPITREAQMTPSFAQVITNVAPSVVNVYSTKTVNRRDPEFSPLLRDPFFRKFFGDQQEVPESELQQEQGLGSGVIVTRDGYILTNNHVVDGAEEIRAVLHDGTEFQAVIVGTDPPTDLAVLKVEAENLPAVVMADSSNVNVGDVALAIGNPFGVGQTVTMGIVSATGRGFGLIDYEDFIQTDASINPGNSGGALADSEGRLIGINTAILSRTGGFQGIGFAVPVNLARFIMEQILAQGKVVRGYLGVYIQSVTPDLAKAFDVPREGALVGGFPPGSPASKAGLKPGDLIRSINGELVKDSRDLRLRISQTAPGTEINLEVIRDGKKLEMPVTLEQLPSQDFDTSRATEPEPDLPKESFMRGVELTDLNPRIRRQLRIPPDVSGVLTVQVEPGSAAFESGLRPGDVIIEVDRHPVANPKDLARAIGQLDDDPAVVLRVWSRGATRYVAILRGR